MRLGEVLFDLAQPVGVLGLVFLRSPDAQGDVLGAGGLLSLPPLSEPPHAASGTSMATAAVSPIAFFQSIFIDLPFLTYPCALQHLRLDGMDQNPAYVHIIVSRMIAGRIGPTENASVLVSVARFCQRLQFSAMIVSKKHRKPRNIKEIHPHAFPRETPPPQMACRRNFL